MSTLVVDTNVILSALISNSKTRELVINLEPELVAPEAIYEEIEKYRDLIKEKSGLSEEELDELLEKLFKYIKIVPREETENKLEKAEQHIREIYQDDTIFLATALATNAEIWSDDQDLHNQDLVTSYTTEEIIRKIYDPKISNRTFLENLFDKQSYVVLFGLSRTNPVLELPSNCSQKFLNR